MCHYIYELSESTSRYATHLRSQPQSCTKLQLVKLTPVKTTLTHMNRGYLLRQGSTPLSYTKCRVLPGFIQAIEALCTPRRALFWCTTQVRQSSRFRPKNRVRTHIPHGHVSTPHIHRYTKGVPLYHMYVWHNRKHNRYVLHFFYLLSFMLFTCLHHFRSRI